MTLFPDAIDAMMGQSIMGRAQDRGYIKIVAHQIRDYTTNKQMQVDDYPYGGGRGAVMQADPLYRCWEHICQEAGHRVHTVYMSPCGRVFDQQVAKELKANYDHLILVCGHYEGVDQRVLDEIVDEELSIGDYVLTGGELAAMVAIDCIARFIPGVLGSSESAETESFSDGLLEYPQYTRPAEFRGMKVPEVLLNGNHALIERWRRDRAIELTLSRRPELMERVELNKKDIAFIQSIKKDEKAR